MTSVGIAVHQQSDAAIRFDWGGEGASATGAGAGVIVVVDILSFTTALSIAVDYGVEVFPYRLRDASAAAFAASRGAILAVGRREGGSSGVSLSPLSVRSAAAPGGVLERSRRLVLPSPNGSAIAKAMADRGATVVGGSFRNAPAVARWIVQHRRDQPIAVVGAGERWPGDVLRPAVEDMWGAGAVISELRALGMTRLSPEADAAAATFEAVRDRLLSALRSCASGRELIADGFAAEIPLAAEHSVSGLVPVLRGDSFTAA